MEKFIYNAIKNLIDTYCSVHPKNIINSGTVEIIKSINSNKKLLELLGNGDTYAFKVQCILENIGEYEHEQIQIQQEELDPLEGRQLEDYLNKEEQESIDAVCLKGYPSQEEIDAINSEYYDQH